MSIITVLVVRHGESALNAAKDGKPFCNAAGQNNSVFKKAAHLASLTDLGSVQATRLGNLMEDAYPVIDQVHCSEAKPAQHTAHIILQAYVDPPWIKIYPELIERHAGYAGYMTIAQTQRQFPYLEEYWKVHGPFLAHPPGGQSLYDKYCQIKPTIMDILRGAVKEGDSTILIVGHGGVNRCIEAILAGSTLEQAKGISEQPSGSVRVYKVIAESLRGEYIEQIFSE